ncbi:MULTISPECIES: THUMP-like domain-containing protein [unclassified Arenibacter]|uniref:THUMP-like domain-containing protein n=1 Tax=unclassified Arenibacter TaxID=2615047 RepID=UPI000E344725|nr:MULTISPECIES: class I SAM-dependent methyltransferase [unclassified Arenibacter]MCM4164248.1 SAM-dependent methyltransferase [Arenibacter sp. A80]RFT56039.1 class I SAM-dependent methyltransferase [Arenibacter sp. P308M17]
MNKNILTSEIQDFIIQNLRTDLMALLLRPLNFDGVTSKEIVEQIEARNRCRDKLPTWYGTSYIYYPNKLNIEQTSSENAAQYKAGLINGNVLLDMTGGFGVDSYFFSSKMEQVHHCEINRDLSEIAAHNYKIMGKDNIYCHAMDGMDFLRTSDIDFDWVFIDPSRRHDAKGKVFLLSDCMPNVPDHLEIILGKTKKIMIKTAPLLDLSAGQRELRFVKEIHIVAVKNEVKEILWLLERDYENEVLVKTVNLSESSMEKFSFSLNDEKLVLSTYSDPLEYLYEPNSAILKSGGFKTVGDTFKMYKLHDHSHLYTNNQLSEFPGRRFKVVRTIPFNKKRIQQLALKKANITVRNFPISVSEIRKKYKIKDGGDDYLFFTTNPDGEKIVVQCIKI